MSGLSPAFDTALAQDAVPLWHAIELVLPSATVRLLMGADSVTFSGKTFVGDDDTYGILVAVDTVTDGLDAEAPKLNVTIVTPTAAAAAILADPAAQGGLATLWCGSVDMLTGGVIASPDPWFVGELDVPIYSVDQGARYVEYEIASAYERLFDQDEGARLSNAYHQYPWPAELGLEYVTGVQTQMPWGQDAPRPALIRDVLGAPSGGAASGPGLPGAGGFGFSNFL